MAESVTAETVVVETARGGGAAGDGGAFRLSVKQKSLYAVGDIADAMKNVALLQFLLFYLTAVLGMPGSLAGAALAIALAVDAVTDPLFGYMSDNTRSRWGRRHPYMFASGLPFALALGLLFSVPAIDSNWGLFAYVLTTLVVLRISFSAFILPYAALGAELSRDYHERSVIVTYRNFFNICANVACITLGFGVFMAGGGLLDREAYIPFGWTCAAIVLAATLVSASSTLGLRHRLPAVVAEGTPGLVSFLREIRDVFRNPSFLILFLTVVIFWIAQGTAVSLGVHAFRYFWEAPTSAIQSILIANTAGLACGIPLSAFTLRRWEKKDVCAGGLILICVFLFVPPTLGIAGLMPAPGPTLFLVLGVIAFTMGLVQTSVAISFWSMMADAADEHDFLFGSRREALYFSGLTFGLKCAVGLGTLVAGVALDLIGFPRGLAADPGMEIPADTIRNLGLIYGPGAAMISLLSVIVLVRYKLDRRELGRIQGEVARRDRTPAP